MGWSFWAVIAFVRYYRLHDYILCLACGLIALGVSKTRPHCRPFRWDDPTIGYAYGGAGTFPSWTLPLISVLPGVVYVIGEAVDVFVLKRPNSVAAQEKRIELPPEDCVAVEMACSAVPPDQEEGPPHSPLRRRGPLLPSEEDRTAAASLFFSKSLSTLTEYAPWKVFLLRAHFWVLAQAFAVTLAMMMVDCMKVYAGRLRPDFLSRLTREGYTESSQVDDWCVVATGGRVSFPSGHSGISFAAFVPLCFYVLHWLRGFERGATSFWVIMVGLVPLILPITVAISRTRDNRHNFDDICAGSLIGIATALLAVKVNFAVTAKGRLLPCLAERRS